MAEATPDDPNFPRLPGESDEDYAKRLPVKTMGPIPQPVMQSTAQPPIANAVVANRRAGGGMSGTAATAGKAAASSGAATLGVILVNSWMARHEMAPLGTDEALALGGLLTSVIHVTIAILAAVGNKLAQKLGLAVTFPVYINGTHTPNSTETSP